MLNIIKPVPYFKVATGIFFKLNASYGDDGGHTIKMKVKYSFNQSK
jgi:hypothetical protein